MGGFWQGNFLLDGGLANLDYFLESFGVSREKVMCECGHKFFWHQVGDMPGACAYGSFKDGDACLCPMLHRKQDRSKDKIPKAWGGSK